MARPSTLGFPTPAALEAALEALPIPVYTRNSDAVLTWENAAARKLFGDVRGTTHGKGDLLPPEEVAPARERFARALMGRSVRPSRLVANTADGGRVEIQVSMAPLREAGTIVGVFGVAVPVNCRPGPRARKATLTRRQREVLHLLVEGKTTDQIAAELHIAPVTVRNYVNALLRELNASSRLEAVLIALREGLVSLELDSET